MIARIGIQCTGAGAEGRGTSERASPLRPPNSTVSEDDVVFEQRTGKPCYWSLNRTPTPNP